MIEILKVMKQNNSTKMTDLRSTTWSYRQLKNVLLLRQKFRWFMIVFSGTFQQRDSWTVCFTGVVNSTIGYQIICLSTTAEIERGKFQARRLTEIIPVDRFFVSLVNASPTAFTKTRRIYKKNKTTHHYTIDSHMHKYMTAKSECVAPYLQ